MSEHKHQVAVIDWANAQSGKWPELRLLFAIPNGGERNKAVAGKLKAEGVKSGVPDLCLPVARGTYHGLFIEMKEPGKPESNNQREWLAALKGQGYYTCTAHGMDVAIQILKTYLQWHSTRIITEDLWELLPEALKQVKMPKRHRCQIAATILPLRQCQLEEGHEGPCYADPAIRSL